MTERQIKNIIKKEWQNCCSSYIKDGEVWYKEAREFCENLAKKHNLDIVQVSAIFAVLSPLKSVSENKRLTEQFLKGKNYGHFRRQIDKAKEIKNTTDLNTIQSIVKSQKCLNFFMNIYSPSDNNYVTVDRHIAKLVFKGESKRITPRRYRIISDSIKSLAKEVNLPVSSVQGSMWLLAKNKYGINI